MAWRGTREEAEQVADGIRGRLPHVTIVVREIETGFIVAEQRVCKQCGVTYTTEAIGEYEPYDPLCSACRQARSERLAAQSEAKIAQARGRQCYAEFHDLVHGE